MSATHHRPSLSTHRLSTRRLSRPILTAALLAAAAALLTLAPRPAHA